MSLGQDVPPEEAPQLSYLIPPEPGQIGKNIHFVVDFSGSMEQDDISAAINQTIAIACQSVDEINIKVTVFGGNYYTWEGIENKKQPGWTALPSQEAIDSLKKWFAELSIDKDSTYIAPAMGAALMEDIENMSVIVISDLCFNDPQDLYFRINHFQNLRTHKATMGFIGIEASIIDANIIFNKCKEWNAWMCHFGRGNFLTELQEYIKLYGGE